MSKVETTFDARATAPGRSGWSELWLKEDWWAIWLGLGIVAVGLVLFAQGASWRWVAVTPAKWSNVTQLTHRPYRQLAALCRPVPALGFVLSAWVFAAYWTNLGK